MSELHMKYFVLKPKGLSKYAIAARHAMLMYATVIKEKDPELAKELVEWVAKEGPQKLTTFVEKAEKWDDLNEKVSKCYCDVDGEYSEDNPEIEGADLGTIGEITASALGWL